MQHPHHDQQHAPAPEITDPAAAPVSESFAATEQAQTPAPAAAQTASVYELFLGNELVLRTSNLYLLQAKWFAIGRIPQVIQLMADGQIIRKIPATDKPRISVPPWPNEIGAMANVRDIAYLLTRYITLRDAELGETQAIANLAAEMQDYGFAGAEETLKGAHASADGFIDGVSLPMMVVILLSALHGETEVDHLDALMQRQQKMQERFSQRQKNFGARNGAPFYSSRHPYKNPFNKRMRMQQQHDDGFDMQHDD